MTSKPPSTGSTRLNDIVAGAQRQREQRERDYREQALKLYPWVCGRCAREFDRSTLRELTVHHKDHNHDHNPPDGSNWELLCLYCHDNEHSRLTEAARQGDVAGSGAEPARATHNPFADLKSMLKDKQGKK